MMSLYVCLANPEDHLDHIEEIAESGEGTNWTIHSNAQVGDTVLFYFTAPLSALVARRTVTSIPAQDDPNWRGFYMSDIADVRLLPRHVSIRELKADVPKWRWLLSPIKSSRVPDDALDALEPMLSTSATSVGPDGVPDVDVELSSTIEGRARWVKHLQRERSASIVRRKREAVLDATDALACEACGFDFAAAYGERGEGFCEVHHLVPLAAVLETRVTRLEDLAIVCSNCHRMIHLAKPMLTPKALSKIVRRQRSVRGH